VTGLLPKHKYRFTILAYTSVGVSTDPNFVEVMTSSAESKLKIFISKNINNNYNIQF
jgi:hypothetical protein